MRFRYPALGLLLTLPFLASCGDSTSAPVPSRIIISPANVTLTALGLTQAYTASLEDAKGRPITNLPISWSSSDPNVASLTSGGLATALQRGTTTIQASAEGLTASTTLTVTQLPTSVEKVSGDDQTGALSQPLAQALAVEVKDSQGNPISGQIVSFGIVAGGGTLSPSSATTDAQGLATSIWTLGCSNDNPQRAVANSAGITVQFSAQADLDLLAICQNTVPNGRETLPYSVELVAVGGDSSTTTWSLQGGALPSGLNLSTQGLLSGTPTQAGSFTFQAMAQDGTGHDASAQFELKICEAPVALEPGESVSVLASDAEDCDIFLPAGDAGDRYRLGVTWATSDDNAISNIPSVSVTASKVLAQGVSPQRSPIRILDPPVSSNDEWIRGLPESFQEAVRVDMATEAFHERLRRKEWETIRRMGPGARLLPDRGQRQMVSGPQMAAPATLSIYPNGSTKCSATNQAKATALLVAENEFVAFYQDSAQAQIDSLKITPDLANQMLDYFRDYGKPVIDRYFDGVSDINGDGLVVVIATPAVSSGVAAFVWSGDFFSSESCGASNEMELIRFNAGVVRGILEGNYQAFATLVHEMKHVSSLYKGISRYYASSDPDEEGYHPTWIEEGTAEIAGEMSSRLAWADAGGPPLGSMIQRSDKVITKESYGVLLRWVRTIHHLGIQPNGLVGTPSGADDSHTLYGSGWHFHRWLGDAFGNAATPWAEATLFKTLNDSLTASGPKGIQDVTGLDWNSLLDQYYSAVLLNGTGAPQPSWGYTSYDFVDVTTGLLQTQRPGFYPWPVNLSGNNTTMTFSSFFNQGTVGPSGLRAYDLTSDGEGLGLEIGVETTAGPIRVIIVRIQ